MTHKKNLMKNSINLSKMISRSLEPLPFLISTGGGFHRMKGAPGGAGGRRSFFCPSRFLRCLFNGEWVISGAKNRACISRKKKRNCVVTWTPAGRRGPKKRRRSFNENNIAVELKDQIQRRTLLVFFCCTIFPQTDSPLKTSLFQIQSDKACGRNEWKICRLKRKTLEDVSLDGLSPSRVALGCVRWSNLDEDYFMKHWETETMDVITSSAM